MITEGTWHETDGELHPSWRKAFNEEPVGADLTSPCPSCGRQTLHRWFRLDFAKPKTILGVDYSGHGRAWEWCSHCRTFEHYMDGFVPVWWDEPYSVSSDALTYHPEAIEEARRKSLPPV
ncbi:hypothetical protein [Streptomyces sp. NPDC001594]|uniref:hypothetical protein n=1 Tax=Streptomyces sp. NPDC001594 TaxID=3364590 RepID=UPI0036994BD4